MEDKKKTTPRPKNFKPKATFGSGKRRGQRRCKGWGKHAGLQCRRSPLRGRDFCRLHGGTQPVGYDHPATTHAKFSKYVGQLSEAYRRFLTAADLHSLDDATAMSYAVVEKILEEMESTPVSDEWFKQLIFHRKRVFGKKGKVHVNEILRLIDEGGGASALRKELRESLDAVRKLSESARKARHEEKLFIRVEQMARNTIELMEDIKQEFVTDPRDQQRLHSLIQRRLLGHRPFETPGGEA